MTVNSDCGSNALFLSSLKMIDSISQEKMSYRITIRNTIVNWNKYYYRITILEYYNNPIIVLVPIYYGTILWYNTLVIL